MAFDFKKEFKQIYAPAKKPSIIEVPKMNYVAVRGKGDPNDESGEYKQAIELLYGLSYTLKMSYKGGRKIDGFSNTWFRRWKVCGGKRMKMQLIIQIKTAFHGYRLLGCLIL